MLEQKSYLKKLTKQVLSGYYLYATKKETEYSSAKNIFDFLLPCYCMYEENKLFIVKWNSYNLSFQK